MGKSYNSKYDALSVADYVIYYSNRKKYAINNLRLQKILYFIQAQFLVALGVACFPEEIEAWDFGPVVPEVYRTYHEFGSFEIPLINSERPGYFAKSDKKMIDEVVDICSKWTSSEMVELTHLQDPWICAYKPGLRAIMSKESIQRFFEEEVF